jgi:hypothetical protein
VKLIAVRKMVLTSRILNKTLFGMTVMIIVAWL